MSPIAVWLEVGSVHNVLRIFYPYRGVRTTLRVMIERDSNHTSMYQAIVVFFFCVLCVLAPQLDNENLIIVCTFTPTC